MDNELLVKSIKELCDKNNVSISKLEKDLGFSAALISRWKDKVPSLDKIIDIADYFHVTLDEVVGRNQISDDAFINKLIELTENEIIIWHPYSEKDSNVKQYFSPPMDRSEFFTIDDYHKYCESHPETSYYAIFNEGYISIYSQHLKHKTNNPYDLKLFIQANKDTELVQEEYDTEQLLSLWLKVLVSLKEGKPDDLQATDLKHQIMLKSSKKPLKLKINRPNMGDRKTEVEKLLEKYGDTQLSQLITVFSQPEMVKAIKTANAIIERLNKDEIDSLATIVKKAKEKDNNKRAGD